MTERSPYCVFEHRVECWALIPTFGSADALILVCLDDQPATVSSHLLKDEPLVFGRLVDAAGVALYSDQQAIDSTTPMGRAMIQMASVFGEQERQIIRSRVLAGLDRVRQQGKKLGRPNVVADGSDCQRNNAGWAITHLGRRISVNTHDAVATSTAMATMLPEPLAVLALDPAPYEIGASGRPQRCGIGTSHGPASVAASSPTC